MNNDLLIRQSKEIVKYKSLNPPALEQPRVSVGPRASHRELEMVDRPSTASQTVTARSADALVPYLLL